MNIKEKAFAFINAVNTRNVNTIKELVREDYIQHNPHVPTGREAFLSLLPALEKHDTKVKTIRIIEDGNFIVMHNHWTNATPFGAEDMVAFDILRFDDQGKIAEHWDALIENVKKTVSGRTLIDGPTEIKDIELTKANKDLVSKFVSNVLIGGNREVITDYISPEKYDQHNPHVGDGLQGLFEAIQSGKIKFDIHKAHAIFAEGSFVLTVNEGELNDEPTCFYDLFHIEERKITEHWDITPTIPSEGLANENGLFNF